MQRPDAYFAGVIDGEACIGVYPNRKNGKPVGWGIRIWVGMCHRPTVIAFQRHFGVGKVLPYDRKQPGKPTKQLWRWTVSNRPDVRLVLERVQPYMIEKRVQAGLGIRYCKGEISGDEAHSGLKAAKRFSYSTTANYGRQTGKG